MAGTNQLFTRVSPTQQCLLKTRFLSRAASCAIFFKAFPMDLETLPYASDCQTVKCARKPKSSSRTCWIDICSKLEVLTWSLMDVEMNTNISVHPLWEFRRCDLRRRRCGNFDSVVCRRRTSGSTNVLSIFYGN